MLDDLRIKRHVLHQDSVQSTISKRSNPVAERTKQMNRPYSYQAFVAACQYSSDTLNLQMRLFWATGHTCTEEVPTAGSLEIGTCGKPSFKSASSLGYSLVMVTSRRK